MQRLEDAIQICRAMFTQEVATFEGRHHHIRGALNFPRPVQPGGPKIMVGGSGEQRTLRLVARYADACNLFGDVDTIRHKLAVLEQHCRDVGRAPAEITKTRLGTLVIADTKKEAEARLEERRAAGVDPERLRTYVVGDPDTVSHQVQAYFDAGLDGLIFNMPPGTAPEIASLGGGRSLSDSVQRPSAHRTHSAWKASRRLASCSTSRRATRGRGSNGSHRTRRPSYRQVPATVPSTRNVETECGVLVLKTSGR